MKRAIQIGGVALMLIGIAGTAKRPSPAVAIAALAAVALAVLLAMRALAASWRGESAVHKQPELLEQAESRVGRPLELLCPFTLLAQDHCGECWQGRQYLWLGLDEEQLWLLHDAHRHPAHGRQPTSAWLPRIGGVWDAFPAKGSPCAPGSCAAASSSS